MAWGGRQEVGWIQTMNNGKYAMDVYIWYQVDEANRKIRVRCDNERVRSLTGAHSYYYSANNGHQMVNGTNDEQYGRVYDRDDTVRVSCGGSWTLSNNTTEAERTMVAAVYSYNADGKLSGVTVASQMIMNVPGYNASYYGFLQQDWTNTDLSGRLPSISKAVDAPTSVSVDPGHILTNSAIITWVGNTKAVKYELTIKGNDQTNTIETTNNTYTFTNLKANTKYAVSICAVDKDGNKSNSVSIDFTTRAQSVTSFNVGGEKKTGKISVLVGSGDTRKLKKAVNVWVNVNGTAKKMI